MLSSYCALMLGLVAVIDVRFAVYSVIGIVAGIVLFYRGFRMLQFKRLVLNTPFSKIRSASMGLVEVSGTATGPQTIPAGITGAACYYYCATAWELRQSGNNRQWKKVAEETLYVPFFVDDSTGRLLVDPQGADLDVHRTFRDEFDKSLFGSNMFPENVTQFLARNGVGASGNIRLEEHCIEPGYPLFILGTLAQNTNRANSAPATHVPIPGSSIRSRSSFSFSFGSANGWFQGLTGVSTMAFGGSATQIPMSRVADAPPERIAASATVAPGNWSSVSMDDVHPPIRSTAAQAPSREVAARAATAVAERPQATQQPQPSIPPQSAGFDTHPAVVLAKGAGNDPFAISSQSQRDVVRALAWKSTACIWGGPLLTMICFYILSEILGWL
ncbi:MAG: GIDE domain-containing protein [Candidatus Acidiferrales bacterium]